MVSNQTVRGEKAVRAPIWSGTVVALVALIGVDCAVAGRTAADRGHKSATIAVRAMTPTAMAVRATTVKLVLVGASLLVLLMLSRQVSCFAQRPIGVPFATWGGGVRLLPPARKTTISFHTGGLYGP